MRRNSSCNLEYARSYHSAVKSSIKGMRMAYTWQLQDLPCTNLIHLEEFAIAHPIAGCTFPVISEAVSRQGPRSAAPTPSFSTSKIAVRPARQGRGTERLGGGGDDEHAAAWPASSCGSFGTSPHPARCESACRAGAEIAGWPKSSRSGRIRRIGGFRSAIEHLIGRSPYGLVPMIEDAGGGP